jgi:DNA-binding CsgD family transcriptional regulator
MGIAARWLRDEQDIVRELAVLEEWEHVQRHLMTVMLSVAEAPGCTWRDMFNDNIAYATNNRARMWWEPLSTQEMTACDRLFEVRHRATRYGLLGLETGYLVSHLVPAIPEYVAHLCGLLLALVEREVLVFQQTRRLPPLCQRAPIPPLTARERDVLLGLMRGESESLTARRLGITPATVRTHRQRLYRRLEVHSPQEAVWRSFTLRLLDWLIVPADAEMTRVQEMVPVQK